MPRCTQCLSAPLGLPPVLRPGIACTGLQLGLGTQCLSAPLGLPPVLRPGIQCLHWPALDAARRLALVRQRAHPCSGPPVPLLLAPLCRPRHPRCPLARPGNRPACCQSPALASSSPRIGNRKKGLPCAYMKVMERGVHGSPAPRGSEAHMCNTCQLPPTYLSLSTDTSSKRRSCGNSEQEQSLSGARSGSRMGQ
jgi:hypothetical protein